MSGKDHDTRAGFKRRNQIDGQYSARLIEMLESPAWRTLTLSARKIIDRISIELAHHGGNDNGQLPVTFEDFQAYGIHHDSIAPAIREAEALGFIRVTERGRGGNAEYRQPNLFFLTFINCRSSMPTHEWRRIKTVEEAEMISHAARNNKSPRAVQFAESRAKKTKYRTRKPGVVSHPETRGETVQVPPPESGSTVSLRKPGPLSISWVRGRYPRAQSTPQWTGYTKLPLELRMMALGLPADGAAA
jgi:hypothetical protein